jgi:regulator of replication initiation timing
MVSVKDVCDPVTGLIKRVKDRQIASELREIQALIASLQSAHFETRERNIKLLSENARLQWENTDLRARQSAEIARLKQEQADAITQLKKGTGGE